MRNAFRSIIIIIAVMLAAVHAAAGSKAVSLDLAWKVEGVDPIMPSPDGRGGAIAVVAGRLVSISAEGKVLWSTGVQNDISAVVSDGVGGAWAACSRTIARFKPDGKLAWSYEWEHAVNGLEAVSGGRVAASTEKGAILLTDEGKLAWLYDPATGCDT